MALRGVNAGPIEMTKVSNTAYSASYVGGDETFEFTVKINDTPQSREWELESITVDNSPLVNNQFEHDAEDTSHTIKVTIQESEYPPSESIITITLSCSQQSE